MSLMVKPQLLGAPSPEAHLAYAGSRLHSNNTAEFSSIIEAHSFFGPSGPVASELQAFAWVRSARARMSLARITMQHIYSHAQNLGNACADHAAALGVYGLISNQNIHTRWVHSSIDSRLYCFVYCMW